MWGPANGEAQWKIRRFGTLVAPLLEWKVWLLSHDCRQVAMESTGPYWEPVFNVLEEGLKNRRGRQTDKKPWRGFVCRTPTGS